MQGLILVQTRATISRGFDVCGRAESSSSSGWVDYGVVRHGIACAMRNSCGALTCSDCSGACRDAPRYSEGWIADACKSHSCLDVWIAPSVHDQTMKTKSTTSRCRCGGSQQTEAGWAKRSLHAVSMMHDFTRTAFGAAWPRSGRG